MTDNEHRLCQELSERQQALTELIEATRHDLLWFASRLEARLIESGPAQQSLQQYLLRSPRHQLRLLVSDAAALVRDCPRLVALCRRLPSRCQMRIPAADAELLDEVIILADRPYALHRPVSERILHRYLPADPQGVAPLRQRTETLWDHARLCTEFRDLVI